MTHGISRAMTLTIGAAETALIRAETLAGKEYTVVPVIAVVEGVLQGANSTEPELAVASEFGKYPDAWNGRPVVLRHPQVQGIYVSANHPQIMEDWHFGFMFNTMLDGTKLKTEAWIDNARVAELGGDFQTTLDRINAGEVINVSVGIFMDARISPGTYEGKKYSARWENVVPDHLAILPDDIGACSVADGCGTNRVAAAAPTVLSSGQFFRAVGPQGHQSCCDACAQGDACMSTATPAVNAEEGATTPPTPSSPPSTPATPSSPPSTPAPTPAPAPAPAPGTQQPGTGTPANEPGPTPLAATTNSEDPAELQALAARGDERLEVLQGLATNALGDAVELGDARRLVRDALPTYLQAESWQVDLMAMTENKAVFYMYGEPEVKGFNQISYSVSNEGAVSFTGKPEPVNLMTRIMPRQTVSANSGIPNSEEDGAMSGNTGQGGVQPPNTDAGAEGTQTGNAPAAPAVNASAPTLDEFIASAPAEMRGVFTEALELRKQQKDSLISGIKANSRNRFTDAQLEAMDLPQLTNLAALADIPTYEGRALGEGVDALNVNASRPAAVDAFMSVNTDYLLQAPSQGNA
jgi:hypothetical protein